MTAGSGTKEDPWVLSTPPGSSQYTMYKDEEADPPALVCQVGSTTLRYHVRAIEDLHAWLREQDDWVPLGAADENKPAADGTVEAWGRAADNPVGGWYGLRKGYRGRFGMYLPPLLEELGLAELTHDARNNRMRAREGVLVLVTSGRGRLGERRARSGRVRRSGRRGRARRWPPRGRSGRPVCPAVAWMCRRRVGVGVGPAGGWFGRGSR